MSLPFCLLARPARGVPPHCRGCLLFHTLAWHCQAARCSPPAPGVNAPHAASAAACLPSGDVLMRWTDGELKSTYHRGRAPKEGDPTVRAACTASLTDDLLSGCCCCCVEGHGEMGTTPVPSSRFLGLGAPVPPALPCGTHAAPPPLLPSLRLPLTQGPRYSMPFFFIQVIFAAA